MTEKMKPSGIAWIGDIPSEWESTKIKYCVQTIGSGTTPDSGNPAYYDDGIFPWIQSGDLYGRSVIRDTEKRITKSAIVDFPALSWYEKDFVVIAMYGASVGNVAISKIDSYTNQACCVIKTRKDGDLRYLYYYLSAAQEDMLQKAFGGTQPNISQVIIKNLSFLNVPTKEQTQIADFLDVQCAKIDSVIADIEKQIEILQKYKKSLITEAVTKGLDQSVSMKDSGIEWIGKIPAHWERTRIKYKTATIGSGTTPDSGNPMYYDGSHPWIQSGDLYNTDYILGTEKQITDAAIADCKALTKYVKDFVVVAMYGASVGNVSISKIDAYTNQACCTMKLQPKNDIRYLYYFLKASQEEMLLKAFGGTQPNISQIIVKNLNYLEIPYSEQVYISNYLDHRCEVVNTLISTKKQQLEKIKQHKKSLIYEYVTGKKRVTEVN